MTTAVKDKCCVSPLDLGVDTVMEAQGGGDWYRRGVGGVSVGSFKFSSRSSWDWQYNNVSVLNTISCTLTGYSKGRQEKGTGRGKETGNNVTFLEL